MKTIKLKMHETIELIDNNPGIISSTTTILQLWDDLGSPNVTKEKLHISSISF